MSVRGYDFTYLANEPTGEPLPGFTMAGRWWAFARRQLATPAAREEAMAAYALDITQVMPQTPPALQRVPALDLESTPPEEMETVIADSLERLGKRLFTKCLTIGWWAGVPDGFSFTQIVKALEGGASKDRTKMFAAARLHRPIIRAAGVCTQLGSIDRPDGGSGPNSEFGTTFYLRKMKAQAAFLREAYPGTELCLWTAGAYIGAGQNFAEFSQEDCERLADVIWENYDSFALYGETRHNVRLGKVLSERLTNQ